MTNIAFFVKEIKDWNNGFGSYFDFIEIICQPAFKDHEKLIVFSNKTSSKIEIYPSNEFDFNIQKFRRDASFLKEKRHSYPSWKERVKNLIDYDLIINSREL